MSSQKPWPYLEICRGRFLCEEHGGFCDSSDNYSRKCPLCCKSEECDLKEKVEWVANPVDRGLQIMRNLQNRSARNASIVAGLFGLLSAIFLLNGGDTKLLGQAFQESAILKVLLGAAIPALLSLGLFLFSMSHMPTIDKNAEKNAKFMIKTCEDWEAHVATHLWRFETSHKLGIYFYIVAVILLIFGLLAAFLCESSV